MKHKRVRERRKVVAREKHIVLMHSVPEDAIYTNFLTQAEAAREMQKGLKDQAVNSFVKQGWKLVAEIEDSVVLVRDKPGIAGLKAEMVLYDEVAQETKS